MRRSVSEDFLEIREKSPPAGRLFLGSRGQVTIFILLGILILVSISVVVYYTTQRFVQPIEGRVFIPPDVQPFYDFTSSCISTVARQGLVKMGLQGGYATLPYSVVRNPRSYVSFDPGGVIKVPHWHYNGEDRTPSKEFLQRELTKYIVDNLDPCFRDFEAFKDFSVEARSKLIPIVDFTDTDVLISLDWSVDLKYADKTVNVPKVVTRVPVKIKRMLELADAIMKAENKHALLENVTIDLLALDPRIPLEGVEFDCTPKRWPILGVKQELQNLLKYNVPQARVKNTLASPFNAPQATYRRLAEEHNSIIQALTAGAQHPSWPQNTPDDAYYYFHMNFDVGASDPELRVGFQYLPEWGMELDVQPRDGGVLRSNLVKGARQYLSFVCINQYHFTYDIVYPVVVNIRDDSAFRGDGYQFQFAFPVIVDNNGPGRYFRGQKSFDTAFFDTGYCSRFSGPTVEFTVDAFETGLPFAVAQGDAELTFQCGVEECSLGKTRPDEGKYRLRTQLPEGCGNPFIVASKEGYLPEKKLMVSSMDKELKLVLTKLKDMKVRVVKHKYYAVDNRLDTEPLELPGNEHAIIYVSLKNTTVPFDQYAQFPAKDGKGTIDLAEDTRSYDMTVFVTDAFGELIAGYSGDALPLSYKNIAAGDEIVFHTLQPATLPKTDEAKAQIVSLIFGDQFTQALQPTFS